MTPWVRGSRQRPGQAAAAARSLQAAAAGQSGPCAAPWSLGLPIALGDSAQLQAPINSKLVQALGGSFDLVAVPGVGEGADRGQGEELDQPCGLVARQGTQREGPGLGQTQGGWGAIMEQGGPWGHMAGSSHTSFLSTSACRMWKGRWPRPSCP